MKKFFSLFFVLVFATAVFGQRALGVRPTDTGGPLMFEQAAYDVQTYDITLRIFPDKKSITGTTLMIARTVIPTNVIGLDLDTPYSISSAFSETQGKQVKLKWERRGGKIWVFCLRPLLNRYGSSNSLVLNDLLGRVV